MDDRWWRGEVRSFFVFFVGEAFPPPREQRCIGPSEGHEIGWRRDFVADVEMGSAGLVERSCLVLATDDR